MTTEKRYAELVDQFLELPDVSQQGRGFGATALQVNGAIFAMLSSRNQFVVKLPRQRVDALVDSGDGDRFDTGQGRLMNEWLALRPESDQDWASLAHEALQFVAAGKQSQARRSRGARRPA